VVEPPQEEAVRRPPSGLTERAFLIKWLRASAAYHERWGGDAELSTEMCRALGRLGVVLDLQHRPGKLPNEITPAQALRYADQLARQEAA